MELIEQHYRDNLQKLTKRMTFRSGSDQDAQDIVQEAYYRALKYIGSFNGESFDRWFSRILNNCLREFKNNEKGFAGVSFEEEEVDGTPCTYYDERVMSEIHDLIATKSLVQMEVLTLHLKQGYTAKDVSEITEYSYANCHKIINRFQQELKELYGRD